MIFVDPITKHSLLQSCNGDLEGGTTLYNTLSENKSIYNFLADMNVVSQDESVQSALREYSSKESLLRYRNFLDWLFETLNSNEKDFRLDLIDRLELAPGQRVLITSCGLGEEIGLISEDLFSSIELHAQDLSKDLVLEAFARNLPRSKDVTFTVSNAMQLPYSDSTFDRVLHFGGINQFTSIKGGIAEMSRVCKVGGKVLFGDEGISPNLKETKLYKMLVNNNILWCSTAPIHKLPTTAINIKLEYILCNCFWLLEFRKSKDEPPVNIDVPHKGLRGGTVRTRYDGAIEGIDPQLREKVYNYAKTSGISVSDLTQEAIEAFIKDS